MKKTSLLDAAKPGAHPIAHAHEIQKLAAEVNFDWTDVPHVIEALKSEISELEEAYHDKHSLEEQHKELGDIIFTCINLARHLNTTAEETVKLTSEKFTRRFSYVEQAIEKAGLKFSDLNFQDMLKYWNEAKQLEK